MKLLFLPILILFFLYSGSVYPAFFGQGYRSDDEKLKRLAVKEGIIPEHVGQAYIDEQIEKGNTLHIWLIISKKDKIILVDRLKEVFKKDGVIINYPSTYYVDQMNKVFISNIENKEYDYTEGPGLKPILATLAAMEGDFNDGRDKVEILREHLGEELFEQYREQNPDMYKNLLQLDRKIKDTP